MAFFVWIDDKVLWFFTKISHKFQILTGRTNFFLAKVCIFLIVAVCLFLILNYYSDILGRKTDVFSMGLMVYMIWSLYSQARASDFAANKFLQDPNFMNERAVGLDRVMRIIALFCCIPITITSLKASSNPGGVFGIKIFCSLAFVYFIAEYYFMAVTPLPPGRSKVREFLDSLVPKPEPLPVGNKRPR